MTGGGLSSRPSDKDAIVSAPFSGGQNVLASVNKYPGVGHRERQGALIEETSAFRLDVEQLYDLHVLLWSPAAGATLDVRDDAVASSIRYESSRVPLVHLHNAFRFPDGEAASLDQSVLVSASTPTLLVRNHARFERERQHTLFTTVGLGMDDARSGHDVKEATRVRERGHDFVVADDGSRSLAIAQHRPGTGQTDFDGQRIGRQAVSAGAERSAWHDIYVENDGAIDDTTHATGKVDVGIGLHAGRDASVEWTTAVGFGRSDDAAVEAALWSLRNGFANERSTFAAVWESWHDTLRAPSPTNASARRLFELSLTSIKCAQDRLGGVIAGAFKPQEFSYRHVWPRDLVMIVQALAAVGATAEARNALDWLDRVQITDDVTDDRGIQRRGTWWQNYYTDGTEHWTTLQLDQVGGPVYAHWLLWRETGDYSLLEAHYPMSRRAAEFLLEWDDGGFPAAHQDPWEEIWGRTTEGSAAAIAGLRAMGELAEAAGDDAFAARCRDRAATWASNFDERCFVEDGLLGAHYVTATDPEWADDPPADRRPDGAVFMAHWPWNVVDADADTLASTLDAADDPPWRAERTPCLGRYPGDDYTPTGVAEDGGWPICEAYADVARWQSGRDPDAVSDHLRKHAVGWTTSADLLPERVDGAGRPRWNANLLWGQAMYVLLAESQRRGEPYGMAPDA